MRRSPTHLRWLGPAALVGAFAVAVGLEGLFTFWGTYYDPVASWSRVGVLRLSWFLAAAAALLAGVRRG